MYFIIRICGTGKANKKEHPFADIDKWKVINFWNKKLPISILSFFCLPACRSSQFLLLSISPFVRHWHFLQSEVAHQSIYRKTQNSASIIFYLSSLEFEHASACVIGATTIKIKYKIWSHGNEVGVIQENSRKLFSVVGAIDALVQNHIKNYSSEYYTHQTRHSTEIIPIAICIV